LTPKAVFALHTSVNAMTITRFIVSLVLLAGALAASVLFQAQIAQGRATFGSALTEASSAPVAALADTVAYALLKGEDKAARAAAADAVQRGIFDEVWLEQGAGQVLFRERAAEASAAVPAWFVRALYSSAESVRITQPLNAPGSLALVVRPPLEQVVAAAWWRFIAAFLVLLLGLLVLCGVAFFFVRGFRRDLARVEQQLLDGASGRFTVLSGEPRLRELQSLFAATNTFIQAADQRVAQTQAFAERLRQEAYSDAVTGAANRRALDLRLDSLRSDPEACASGALLWVRTEGLREYNDQYGVAAGDRLMRQLAETLAGVFPPEAGAMCARVAGADFALFVSCADRLRVEEAARSLSTRLAELAKHHNGLIVSSIGVALYHGRHELPQLLDAGESAAKQAREGIAKAWVVTQVGTEVTSRWIMPDAQWRVLVEDALVNRQFVLMQQPVVASSDGHLLHFELFVRLQDAFGELIPAGVFMPIVARLGLASQLDRAVLTAVMSHLEGQTAAVTQYAVNLSNDSLCEPAFVDWLCQSLLVAPQAASSLILEFAESGVGTHARTVNEFVHRVRALGASVSLDHCGVGYATIGQLRGLGLDFVKLDAGYARQIERSSDNRNAVRTMVDIGRALGVKVIAQSVESDSAWETFKACDVFGGRGYWLGKLEPFAAAPNPGAAAPEGAAQGERGVSVG
jgi:diguanylate cyclase (GGDEF)-like protein